MNQVATIRAYHSLSDTEIETTRNGDCNNKTTQTSVKVMRKDLRKKFQQNLEQPESRNKFLPNIINDIIFEDFIDPYVSPADNESINSERMEKITLRNNSTEKHKQQPHSVYTKGRNGQIESDFYAPLKIRDEIRLDLRKNVSTSSGSSSRSSISRPRRNRIFPIEEVSEGSSKSNDAIQRRMEKERQEQIERVLKASRNCSEVRPVSRKPNNSRNCRRIAWPEKPEEQTKCLLELKLSRFVIDNSIPNTNSTERLVTRNKEMNKNKNEIVSETIFISANETTNITITNETIERLLLDDNYSMKIPISMSMAIKRDPELESDCEQNAIFDSFPVNDEDISGYRKSSYSTLAESFRSAASKKVKKSKLKFCCGC